MTIDKKTVTVIILTICFILFGSLYSFFRKQNQPYANETIVHETTFSYDRPNIDSEAEKTIKIYITGEVTHPGTYELPLDTRIEDAVNAAGGALENADLLKINLAAHIKDSQHIHVPTKGEEGIPTIATPESTLVNINTALAQELTKLPQIGPVIAENIIRYREEHGNFEKIEDIKNVSRIGEKTFENIKELITVE